MKILQVVTLVTPDNAYGGPLRVAVNQTRELRERGHEVTLVAGCQGFEGNFPKSFDGVELSLYGARQLFPRIGFAGTVSPSLWWFVARNAKLYDVIHIHLARDLVVLPAALIALMYKVPFVAQTHGMVDESDNPLAHAIDRLAVGRCLRRAKAVFWLTDAERASLERLFGSGLRMRQLANGVPQAEIGDVGEEGSVVTVPTVLFLARMQARKRPMVFVRAARTLIDAGVPGHFVLVGPDEGQGQLVAAAIKSEGRQIRWVGGAAPEETAEFMKKADLYCLPSINEPFPMSVLEALSNGLPVIVTKSCGLAGYITDFHAGLVVDESEEAIIDALRELMTDARKRVSMGLNAKHLANEKFSMKSVGEKLIESYSM